MRLFAVQYDIIYAPICDGVIGCGIIFWLPSYMTRSLFLRMREYREQIWSPTASQMDPCIIYIWVKVHRPSCRCLMPEFIIPAFIVVSFLYIDCNLYA